MQIEHVINDAQCEDSGQVYCKVTGTTAHKSVLLLVLCEYEVLTILVFWNEILHDKKRISKLTFSQDVMKSTVASSSMSSPFTTALTYSHHALWQTV